MITFKFFCLYYQLLFKHNEQNLSILDLSFYKRIGDGVHRRSSRNIIISLISMVLMRTFYNCRWNMHYLNHHQQLLYHSLAADVTGKENNESYVNKEYNLKKQNQNGVCSERRQTRLILCFLFPCFFYVQVRFIV